MKKHHIRFNKAQLRTEVIPYTAKDYVLWLVKRVVMVAGIAAGAVMIFDQYFESPKVRRQQRQIAFLEAQVDLMDGKVEGMRGALAELTDRDEAIYRNIFGAEPYPEHLRNPGIGGADRYRELRGLEQSEQVIALRAEISELERRMLAQGESFSQLVSLTENREDLLNSIPAIQPVRNSDLKRMASGYGYRIHPIYKVGKCTGVWISLRQPARRFSLPETVKWSRSRRNTMDMGTMCASAMASDTKLCMRTCPKFWCGVVSA